MVGAGVTRGIHTTRVRELCCQVPSSLPRSRFQVLWLSEGPGFHESSGSRIPMQLLRGSPLLLYFLLATSIHF